MILCIFGIIIATASLLDFLENHNPWKTDSRTESVRITGKYDSSQRGMVTMETKSINNNNVENTKVGSVLQEVDTVAREKELPWQPQESSTDPEHQHLIPKQGILVS